MKKSLLLTLILFFSLQSGFAQKLNSTQKQKVDQLYKSNSVVYFKFPVASLQEVNGIAKIIKVDNFKGGVVYAHATKDQFSQFIVKNYAYTVVPGKKTAVKAKPKAKPVVKHAAKPAAKKPVKK